MNNYSMKIKVIGLLLAIILNLIVTYFIFNDKITLWTFLGPVITLLPFVAIVKFKSKES